MLFNSYEFILVFLPAVLAGFHLVARYQVRAITVAWLVLASLFFYGWWDPAYLSLLITSILVNYGVGRALMQWQGPARGRRCLVTAGVTFNLALIGYFKYAGFLDENLRALTGTGFELGHIVLPLAISFFTFQQITFLVDAYRGEVRDLSFLNYCLFVSFFPQLIAGPIVHHSEMMPQFARSGVFRLRWSDLAVGLTLFALGLFKKAVLADGIAVYATPQFAAADAGLSMTLLDAWGGALAYTFQLYFDFSGYSDMAIGAARMFGIRSPLNFASPYKATSIVEFWRRWHMTLSRFLRDYVYIPLGGNRRGPLRRHLNLLSTMLIGGLWHGAGWTFIAWGGLHGVYLLVNHAWTSRRSRAPSTLVGSLAGFVLTFVAVVVGWVFFRAETFSGALNMLAGMAGLNGVALPEVIYHRAGGFGEWARLQGVEFVPGGGSRFIATWAWVGTLFLVAVAAPNSQQILRRMRPALVTGPAGDRRSSTRLGPAWRPSPVWALATALVLAVGLLALPEVSEFLYFQF